MSTIPVSMIRKEIQKNGRTFLFQRKAENDYGEKRGGMADVISFKGIYHESKGYVQKSTADGGTVNVPKPQPMILCMLEDTTNLKSDDVVTIGGVVHKLVAIGDVGLTGSIADISLEVVR